MSDTYTDGTDRYETVNEFVIAGEFGFLRVEGPFECEKEGTLWTVVVPTDQDDYAAPNPITLGSLTDHDGESAVVIADGEAVGGGIVKLTNQIESEGELHIVIDQYAMGGPDE